VVRHALAVGGHRCGGVSVGRGREETTVVKVLDGGENGGKIPPSNVF
jgi:hypothetical protein